MSDDVVCEDEVILVNTVSQFEQIYISIFTPPANLAGCIFFNNVILELTYKFL